MKKIDFGKNKQAVAIIAHPDDEVIWMGGMILKHPELKWIVHSLCRASDADREPKFKRVMKKLGAIGVITDLDDEGNLGFEQGVVEAKKLIRKRFEGKSINYLFTHGTNGEYGHEGHVIVNKAVKELIKEKILEPEMVFYFNYKKKSQNTLIPKRNSDFVIRLNKAELEKKKRIVADIYGYDYKGIDVGYCTNPEAFKIQEFNKIIK